MKHISLFYISTVLILTFFFLFMTLKYPNYHNQFNQDSYILIQSKINK